MKFAKTPRQVADAASMMMIHMLSWASGQWYFRRRSTTTTSVMFVGLLVGLLLGRERGRGFGGDQVTGGVRYRDKSFASREQTCPIAL